MRLTNETECEHSKELVMKLRHSAHHFHWLAVAAVMAALLFTLSEAHGQSTGAAAAFEGRPAMSGAQGGLGAQAGPAQGGIGVQGSDGAQRSVTPRGQGAPLNVPQAAPAATGVGLAAAGSDTRSRDDVKPARDQGVAKDQRTAAKKVKRATKRTITRSRHGTSEIDSTAGAAVR
jgi:hypothetical protein